MFFFSQRFHKILVATKHLSWLQTSQLAPNISVGSKDLNWLQAFSFKHLQRSTENKIEKFFILLSDYFQVKVLLLFPGIESLTPNKKMSKFGFFSIVILIAFTVGQTEALSIENQLQKIGTIKQTHINNLYKILM